MTNEQLLEQYIRTEIAEKNILLGHSSGVIRYAATYDEAIQKFNKGMDSTSMVMVLDCMDGDLVNNGSDTETDVVNFTLHFMQKVKLNDFAAYELAFTKAKTLIKQCLSKMYKDRKDLTSIIKYLDKTVKQYEKIEGNMPDNVRGYMVNLRLNINQNLQYQEVEWL